MRSLVGATLAILTGLAVPNLAAGPARGQDAYYPAAADGKTAPMWERPKSTRFSAMRCSPGAPVVDELTLNRDDVSETTGFATYTDAAKDQGYQDGAGGWALRGDQLKVSGDGFELRGRWSGPFLTATITRPGAGEPVRCRFEVISLRSFTDYE